MNNVAAYFLFDSDTKNYGGSGIPFDWQLLEQYKLEKEYFLSGGITPANASKIKQLNDQRLAAVDINSRFETAPGIKDLTTIKSFLYEIRH